MRALACVLALAACDQPQSPSEALHHDLGNNHCPVVTQRPDDCLEAPQCIYFDALLRVKRGAGGQLHVAAESISRGKPPVHSAGLLVASPDEVNSRLAGMMQEIGVAVPISQACLVISADQSLPIGDVAAVQRALTAQVRHVQLTAELADDEF